MLNLKSFTNRFISVLILFLITLLFAGCGGGGGGSDAPANPPPPPAAKIDRQLTGTVAVGAPVAGAITIVDADGNTVTANSDANGTYSVNLEGRRGPYLIRIEPNDANLPVMYSYATGKGVANITPFTSLALFLAYRIDLEAAFTDWVTTVKNWNREDLEQALAEINANFETALLNAGVDPKLYDFFTAPFTANHSGIDAFLDSYTVTIDYTNNSYEITDQSGQTVTFNENIGTTGYYIGAWFVPADTAQWQLTYTYNVNGNESSVTYPYLFPSDNIPWNQDRFNETFWDNLANYEPQTITCGESPNIQCNITYEVTRLESNYEVTGNGEVGTLVTAGAAYNWSMTGYVQQVGQPRQDINYSYSWSFSWSWERIS